MKKINAGSVAGRFKIVAIRPDGTERLLADWFDNLVTDAGLNRLGTGGIADYCRVGSGSAVPNVADTTLQTTVASTNNDQGSTYGQQSAEPWYGFARRRYRFAIGAAAGNLSEVGVGWGVANLIFSRALIVDGTGTPTTITVLSDEILDVTYELRLYPPLTDQVTTVTIAGVDYTITTRASQVNSNWTPQSLFGNGAVPLGSIQITTYQGPIGTITQAPSGTSVAAITGGLYTYANNSNKRRVQGNWTLNDGNLTGGIGAFHMNTSANMGAYQFGISPKLPKDATKLLTVNFEYAWARHV